MNIKSNYGGLNLLQQIAEDSTSPTSGVAPSRLRLVSPRSPRKLVDFPPKSPRGMFDIILVAVYGGGDEYDDVPKSDSSCYGSGGSR